MKCWRLFVLLGALAVPVWAEDGEAPDHGVARISVLSGDVTVRRGDSGEFVAAELNAPLVSLDHLLTDEKSRAEIQLDWANYVRVAAESEVRLAELKDRDFLIQVSAGTATFRVLEDSNSRLEISTPHVAIRPRRHGTYRVTVWDNSTEVTVRSGEAEIFAGGNTEILRAGQTLEVSGDPANPSLVFRSAIPRDEWDRWNEARDKDLERRVSYRYVSRDIYGVEDLYGYGRWVYDAPYGWVWVPNVSVTWAPYRVGRWTWVNYYGWTWVSGDPWGWAPYHYGRWYHAPRYGWVWYPGEVRVRYYWRPALVAFFGWGSVNVGWVPLAPYEVYRPWYGPSRTTVVNYNTRVTNINLIGNFKNARFVSGRTGVTSVVSNDFGRRKTTINNYVVAKDRDLRQVGDAGRFWPNQPSRENRQFSDRKVPDRVRTPPRDSDNRFVSTRPEWNSRGRQPNGNTPAPGNRGRGENAAAAAAGNRPDNAGRPVASDSNRPVAFPGNDRDRGRGAEGNRGRGENPTAAAGRPENPSRPETSDANRVVAFPRNDADRGRGAEGNRGRGENPAAAAGRPENPGRPETPDANRPVVFPRNNDFDRGREAEENNRRQAEENNRRQAEENSRRQAEENRRRQAETSNGNRAVQFPRNEADRGRQPEVNADRRNENAGPPQRNQPVNFPRAETQPQPAREPAEDRGRGRNPNNNNEAARAPEPPRRAEAPQPPPREARPEPERARPQEDNRERVLMTPRREPEPPPRQSPPPEVVRRQEPERPPEQPQGRPGRFPGAEREEPRGNPPSAPAPSSPPPNEEQRGNSGGRGRGRF